MLRSSNLSNDSLTNVKRHFTHFDVYPMIGTIRHKGLRALFEEDSRKGVAAEHVRKLKQILAVMDAASDVTALDLPTFRLHRLKGDLVGVWAVTVRANWRVVFRFKDETFFDVDFVDYH